MSSPALARRALLLFLALAAASPVAASDWKPVDPAHLRMSAPKVDPSADAEALLWEVRVADDVTMVGGLSTTFEHYLSVKVFTERGRDRFATVDIPYVSGVSVTDVAARTIRADGSISELRKSDVYERTILKADGIKVKAVSFAVPGIEKGVLVEYRWREVYRNSIATNLRLRFSRDIPAHVVRYYVRPIQVPGFVMVAWPFNGKFLPPERQKDGSSMITLTDVPGDSDEAYGLPPFEERPWVFISYEQQRRRDPATFYKHFAKELHDAYSRRSKPNDDIRRLAAGAVAGLESESARVSALVRLSREKVRRVDVDTATPEEKRQARETKSAADALKRGVGTADDLMLVFLSLANAAGFDARIAAAANRADIFQRSVQPHPYFYGGRIAAIRTADGWSFVDPTNQHAPAGELPWQYEDQKVLVADERDAIFARTPLAPPAASLKRRTGTFRLLEDGTLAGEARLEYTGHWATVFRQQEDGQTAAEREKDLRAMLTSRFPSAEITDVRIEHVTDTDGPYTNAYRIRIPDYAQRTGARLFLQPSVFQKEIAAVFASVERRSGVYFQYPWAEEDTVDIELPDGFALEAPEGVPPLDAGAVSLEMRLAVEGGKRLVLRRTLTVGKQGAILFDASAYRPLRAFFDAVHRADANTLVLRRRDSGK